MGLFNWLLVGHMVGDYILQTRWMALKKTQELLPLVVHSAVYAIAVALLALLARRVGGSSLSWWGIGLIFISHLILDQRKFINFWAQKITGTTDTEWLKVMLDQSWHILILALATLV